MGTSDRAPGFSGLVHELASFVGKEAQIQIGSTNTSATSVNTTTTTITKPVKVDMHEYNGDWDVLYPFSAVRSHSIYLSIYLSPQMFQPVNLTLLPASSYPRMISTSNRTFPSSQPGTTRARLLGFGLKMMLWTLRLGRGLLDL